MYAKYIIIVIVMTLFENMYPVVNWNPRPNREMTKW